MKDDSTLTNLAQVLDKIIDKTGEGVMFMVDKIQEVAPYAWEIAMRQVWAQSVSNLLINTIILVPFIYLLIFCLRGAKNDENSCNAEEGWVFGVCASGVGVALSTIFWCINANYLLKILINPDYYAILKIAEMAGLK